MNDIKETVNDYKVKSGMNFPKMGPGTMLRTGDLDKKLEPCDRCGNSDGLHVCLPLLLTTMRKDKRFMAELKKMVQKA